MLEKVAGEREGIINSEFEKRKKEMMRMERCADVMFMRVGSHVIVVHTFVVVFFLCLMSHDHHLIIISSL